jgi:hypothetical protein
MTTKYRCNTRDWNAARAEDGRNRRQACAECEGLITYGASAGQLTSIAIQPHQFAMFGEILEAKRVLGRGMLSADVVSAETGER